MKKGYYYKISKVNSQEYLQIWKKENNKDNYVLSLGSASKLVKKFQKKEQTKDFIENQTKNIYVGTSKLD